MRAGSGLGEQMGGDSSLQPLLALLRTFWEENVLLAY